MLDIETLGTASDSVISQVGLVYFDPEAGIIGDSLNLQVDLENAMTSGATVTADALEFWLKQPDAARHSLLRPGSSEAITVYKITQFIHNPQEVNVWANGAAFDIPILENLFKRNNTPIPWSFRNVVDFRTWKKYVAPGKNVRHTGIKHTALGDAKAQAQFVLENWK